MDFTDHTSQRGAATLSWTSANVKARGQSRRGFLFFVSVAVTLGVVAIIEPSPSDIGIIILMAQGVLCGNLRWDRTCVLPSVLLCIFVLSNLASLCYAIDAERGAAFFLVTLFMIVTWLFTVGVLIRFQERGLRVPLWLFACLISSLGILLSYSRRHGPTMPSLSSSFLCSTRWRTAHRVCCAATSLTS
jgi:hypothetical protein